ncbi:hypothetical protein TNCV_4057111 [Trichonephila clavipes]|nr:hypothetical protein TNCV_4057111 [Trichonephila clavipes]
MAILGSQSLPPTDLGRIDEEIASPGEKEQTLLHSHLFLFSLEKKSFGSIPSDIRDAFPNPFLPRSGRAKIQADDNGEKT